MQENSSMKPGHQTPQPDPTPAVDGGTIWVVDDSRLEAERTCRLLSNQYAVRSFDEGGAMLEAISATSEWPDLVLLDWQMPGVSGLEACHFLRERFDEVSLPVLMLTARGEKADFAEGLSAGANDYVAKPYDDAELLARVRTLVRTRRHAEALRSREEMFATTLSSIGDAVITVARDGRITFMNRGAESLTAWSIERAFGKRFSEVFVVRDAATKEPAEDLVTAALHEGKPVVRKQPTVLVRADDREVPIDDSASPIGEAGRLGTVVVARDATERHRAEAQAKDRADLEEKLIGIVSHDLRNPLNTIVLGAEFLTGRDELSDRSLKAALRIRSSAQRATRLVGDLLDFTQARLRGTIPIHRTPVDLHVVAAHVLEESLIEHPHRELVLDARGDASANLDEDRVTQVLTNLITNALKHGDANGRVVVQTRGEEDQVVVAVTNTGPGIPKALLPVLFEPMTRATTEQRDRSVGLGLYIVKHIVEAHGGRTDVTSTPQGTTFSARFPR